MADSQGSQFETCKLHNYTKIENAHKVRKKIFLNYVAVIYAITKGKDQIGLVWAGVINPSEQSVNDEPRNGAHTASTGMGLY